MTSTDQGGISDAAMARAVERAREAMASDPEGAAEAVRQLDEEADA